MLTGKGSYENTHLDEETCPQIACVPVGRVGLEVCVEEADRVASVEVELVGANGVDDAGAEDEGGMREGRGKAGCRV